MIISINEMIAEHRKRYTELLDQPAYAKVICSKWTAEELNEVKSVADKIQSDFLLVIARSLEQINAVTDPQFAYERFKSLLILNSMQEDVEHWRYLRVNQHSGERGLLSWITFTLPTADKLWKETGGPANE